MYEYLEGKLVERNPAYAVIDCSGIGYYVNISLNTYTQLGKSEKAKLFIHFIVREDAMTFFGFFDTYERDVFRKLISVSGVGPSTARMILSSLSSVEVFEAINSGDVAVLKSVKGIGAKSAQRIIVDLKDKLDQLVSDGDNLPFQHNTLKEEALSALLALGFSKVMAEKGLKKVFTAQPEIDQVEQLIKQTLKVL
ncbi:MAG: Holliday junction branch migration protein RuvA [Bacteroidetes bacterium 4572_77]|nr:MAG: Holliday junction branch migration protein RuvA [Bacteroidetes bacterium 4572_77]